MEEQRYIYTHEFNSDGESSSIYGIKNSYDIEKIEGIGYKNGVPFIVPFHSGKEYVHIYLKKFDNAYKIVRESSFGYSKSKVIAYIIYWK